MKKMAFKGHEGHATVNEPPLHAQCSLGLVKFLKVSFSMAWMKIYIFWATLAKELIHFGQKRQAPQFSNIGNPL